MTTLSTYRLQALFLCLATGTGLIGTPSAQEAGTQEAVAFELRSTPQAMVAPETAVQVPLLWRGSMPAVEVWVNGEGPFLFAIDTGGQGSARVQPELIEKLQLPVVGEIRGGDPTGRSTALMPVVEIEHLMLGDVEFEGVQAASRPYSKMPDGTRIDGILGVHLFSDLVLTLDYASSELVLTKPPFYAPRGATLLPLTNAPERTPSVNAMLGGEALELMIDTGKMGGLGVPSELVPTLTMVGEPRVVGRGRTITGEIEIRSVAVEETFELGALRIEQPTLEYAESLPVAILGSRFLQNRTLTLDQTGRSLWIVDSSEAERLAERSPAPDRTILEGAFDYPIDTSSGRPWLEVAVGEREPDRFLFDTGASITVIDDDYARELAPKVIGRRAVGDPASPRAEETDLYLLEEVSFGGVRFEGLPAVAMDLDPVFAGAGETPKAILGLPAFTDLLVTLDYSASMLRIEEGSVAEAEAAPAVVLPFERDFHRGGLPEFTLYVGGTEIRTHIDSGAPMGVSLPSMLIPSIAFVSEPTLVGQARTVSASFNIHRGTIDGEVRLGSLVLPSEGVIFMERLRDGNLGAGFLREYAVTLDLANRRARFVPFGD